MKYGTSVCDEEWNVLMDRARERASITGQRTKIVAVLVSDRYSRISGGRKYEYVINHPEHGYGERRCAAVGPNGKPCILKKNQSSVYHVSRGTNHETFILWNYISISGNPSPGPTMRIRQEVYKKDELTRRTGIRLDV